MYLLDLLRSWPLRRRLRTGIREFVRTAPRPPRRAIVRLPGPDPLQVLLLGSGLAVGYGVRSSDDALDGHLASRLQARTGRGVVLTNLAEQDAPLREQLLSVSISESLDLYDLVLWSPSTLDICSRRLPRGWRALLAELFAYASVSREVVVLALPLAHDGSEDVQEAVRLASRINDQLHRAAALFTNVRAVDVPTMPAPALGRPVFTSEYYRDVAEAVVRVLGSMAERVVPDADRARTPGSGPASADRRALLGRRVGAGR